MKLKNVLDMLKGKDRFETAERWSVLIIVIGAVMLSAGIGLSIISTKGLTAILMMIGAFLSFIATVALIFVWVLKEFLGE
jgi:uncharacterized membrane protein